MCAAWHDDNQDITYGFLSDIIAVLYRNYTKGTGEIRKPKERLKYLLDHKIVGEEILAWIDEASECFNNENVDGFLKIVGRISCELESLESGGLK